MIFLYKYWFLLLKIFVPIDKSWNKLMKWEWIWRRYYIKMLKIWLGMKKEKRLFKKMRTNKKMRLNKKIEINKEMD